MSAFPKRSPVLRQVPELTPPPPTPQLAVIEGGLGKTEELHAFREELSLYENAGWWARLAALMIDGFLLGMIGAATRVVVMRVFGMHEAVSSLLEMILTYLYFTYFLMRRNGQTPSKKFMKLRVLNLKHPDGLFEKRREVFGREYLGRFLSILSLVGYLLPLVRRDGRALHDLVAGTRVIRYD